MGRHLKGRAVDFFSRRVTGTSCFHTLIMNIIFRVTYSRIVIYLNLCVRSFSLKQQPAPTFNNADANNLFFSCRAACRKHNQHRCPPLENKIAPRNDRAGLPLGNKLRATYYLEIGCTWLRAQPIRRAFVERHLPAME